MTERSDSDPKAETLREHRALNPTPERVTDERFQTREFFDPRDLVQVKYEMLRRAREEGATVTDAADAFGFSRPTFYQAQQRLEKEGLAGLVPRRPGPKGAHKLTDEVVTYLEQLRAESPELGTGELAEHVKERFGISVHPRSVERALSDRARKDRSGPS